jgi:PilZ domain
MMERRLGLRGRTRFEVTASNGLRVAQAMGRELSLSGMLVEYEPTHSPGEGLVLRLTITLPERSRPIQALARPVRSNGGMQALRFVSLSDADRLSLAEHLDIVSSRGDMLH